MRSPDDHLRDSHWTHRAACAGTDVEAFFSEAAGGRHAAAIKICAGCAVRGDCLDAALTEEGRWGGTRYGVRGGLSGVQRKKLARTSA